MDRKFIKIETSPTQTFSFKISAENIQIYKIIEKLSNKLYSFKIIDNQKSLKVDFAQSIASTMAVHNLDDEAHSNIVGIINRNIADTNNQIVSKVDKISGKNLSTNDFTDDLKSNYNTAYLNNHTHNNKTSLDAIPAPVVGNFLQGTASGFKNRTPAQIAGDIGASTIGKNLIINGGFFVNQRVYTSGTPTTVANQYTLDRWRVVTSGQNLSWTDSNGKRTITAPAGGVEQVLEGLWLQSGIYTLSWVGTATGYVNGTVITNGGNISLTGGSNVTIKFAAGTVSSAQFEFGSYATQFDLRSFAQELQFCQRYYEKTYPYEVASGTINGVIVGGWCLGIDAATAAGNNPFKVVKRIAPIIKIYSPTTGSAGYARENTGGADVAIIVPELSAYNFNRIQGVTNNIVAGRQYSFHFTADAEI